MEILYGLFNLGICGYMIYIEVMQMKRDRSDYFKQVWNYFDLFQFTGNIFLIVVTMFEVDFYTMDFIRALASMVSIVIWIKMFDWFRIFDTTSFYIKLIMMTIKDILPFFFIFPVFLMTFGTALLILTSNYHTKDDIFIENYVDNWLVNAFIN